MLPLIVQLHFSKLFLILKSGVNHTSRGSISTSTLPSIKLRKCSSKIITSILSFISGRLATKSNQIKQLRSEERFSRNAETDIVCRLLLEKKNALTTFPAARLSDRLGRKTLVYFTCALRSLCMLGVALAPNILVAVLCVIPVGIAAGAFLAVDWALMTDIVPKATSGRYMGISNVVTGAAGPLAIAIGGFAMDRIGAFDFSLGPRVAYLFALVYYALGALLLRPVDERRREQ